MKTAELTRQALELPADERRALAEALWESLEDENAALPPSSTGSVISSISGVRRRSATRASEVEWPEVESDLRALALLLSQNPAS